MPDAHDSVTEKVLAIFTELVGDRAERLRPFVSREIHT